MQSIREEYGLVYFPDVPRIQFGLLRWLYAECWAGNERPGTLVLQAADWLISNNAPGVSTLERLVGRVRERVRLRLWYRLAEGLSETNVRRSMRCLIIMRLSSLEILRASPLKRRQSDFLHHLDRDAVRDFGLRLTPPNGRQRSWSAWRALRDGRPPRLPLKEPRRTATVAALFYILEASAQDERQAWRSPDLRSVPRGWQAQTNNRARNNATSTMRYCCCTTWRACDW